MSRPDDVLRECWGALVGPRPEGAPRHDADGAIDGVVGRYCEPHRRYHTAAHVASVLGHVDRLTGVYAAVDAAVVRAAALFHDVVYDPASTTNEADSAEYAVTVLSSFGWTQTRLDRVAELIEATAGHVDPDTTVAGTHDGQLAVAPQPDDAVRQVDDMDVLLDADLSILGASPSAYADYVAGVRFEYRHVDDELWTIGRAAVLRSLVGRWAIYRTPVMHNERETQARTNLADELAALGASPIG